jgi:hypothetical protein
VPGSHRSGYGNEVLPPERHALRDTGSKLRGVVTDTFIASCMRDIPDGSEFLVLETTRERMTRRRGFTGQTAIPTQSCVKRLKTRATFPLQLGSVRSGSWIPMM